MGNNRRRNPWTAANELSRLSASVSVSFCGRDAFLSISVPKRKGLWPGFMLILQQTQLSVLSATLSSTPESDFHSIHAQIPQDICINANELQKMFEDLIYEELGVQACKA